MEEFANYIRTGEITFKHAKGMRDVVGKEFHTYHEIFFFMGAEAEFITDNGREKLMPHTTVVIPKETFHQFVVHGPETDYCRCVLNFDSVKELDPLIARKLDKIYLVRDSDIADLFKEMQSLTKERMDALERDVLLKAYFAQVVVKLKDSDTGVLFSQSSFHPITRETIQYIDRNLDRKLTGTVLAEQLNVSASYLSQIFRKDMNISLHKYIMEKRLVLASKKIKNSVNVGQAALESGFQDYPNFYRQYKRMFGISPSEAKNKPEK